MKAKVSHNLIERKDFLAYPVETLQIEHIEIELIAENAEDEAVLEKISKSPVQIGHSHIRFLNGNSASKNYISHYRQ